jgi:hypothetical protein
VARRKNAASGPDVGPDPIWGMAVFVIGVLVMAAGGAGNWHWTFNIGMGTLLLGVVLFTIFVAITAVKQDPERYTQPVRRVLRVVWNSTLIGRIVGRSRK